MLAKSSSESGGKSPEELELGEGQELADKLGLMDDEVAYNDVLETNNSAVKI